MDSTLSFFRPRFKAPPVLWLSGVAVSAVMLFLLFREDFSALFTVLIGGGLLLMGMVDRQRAILWTITYLFLMGDIRRIVSLFAGAPANDPLLLIGPIVAGCFAIPLFFNLKLRDTLSKLLAALLVVMILEIANPRQGGLAVGLSGAVFYIAPMFWFWIGRQYASPQLLYRLLFHYLVPLALVAALLGLSQTFIGFLPWEQAWIDQVSKTYTALHLGSTIRAFGFSVSAAEYAYLLGFGAACIGAAFLAGRRAWLLIAPPILIAIVLVSSRGLILKLALAFAVIWALRHGKALRLATLVRIAVFAILGFATISFVAGHFVSSNAGGVTSASQAAIAHQAGGLAHPLDSRYSTAGVHTSMMLEAVSNGFTQPLGSGLGSTTGAAKKFGSAESGSSEVDAADMFVSLGVVGGLLYLAAVLLIVWQAVLYTSRAPRVIALSVLAMLISTLGSWLIGGQYSTASLLFFCVGGLVYQQQRQQRGEIQAEPGAVAV